MEMVSYHSLKRDKLFALPVNLVLLPSSILLASCQERLRGNRCSVGLGLCRLPFPDTEGLR